MWHIGLAVDITGLDLIIPPLKNMGSEADFGTEVVQISLNALGSSFLTTSCRCALGQMWMHAKW
jgi:hypothetical protein